MPFGTVCSAGDTWQIATVKMSDKSEEALQAAYKLLKKYPQQWSYGVACWDSFCKTTGNSKGYGGASGAACHNGVCHSSQKAYVVNAHKPAAHGKFPEFTKWVCREGPFSHGIINKDNEEQILNQGIIIDGDAVGRGGVLWLCKALRTTVEEPWRVKTWQTLVDGGLDGLQAFIGCSILSSTGEVQTAPTHCGLFRYDHPNNIYAFYQELVKERKRDDDNASRPTKYSYWNMKNKDWGTLAFKTVKKSDGWGGFTEVKEPADPTEFIEKLKLIFKGDYKLVS